ncbi:MAG TPA: hypothetical protein PK395_12140 [bacterium]|nr:hypothetical protein [bacterium]
MKKYVHTIRWVGELVVILAVLAAMPWVYEAFSCQGDNYYNPNGPGYPLPIDVSKDSTSTQAARQVTASGNVSIFTNVRFKWEKCYEPNQQGNYYADLDLQRANGINYIIPDTVQYRLYVFGEPNFDWTNDTSSASQQTLYFWDESRDSPYTITYSLHVRDTDHLGPPGTTDDGADEEEELTVNWVAPTSSYASFVACAGYSTYGHMDTYGVMLYNSSDPTVDFNDLYVSESTSEYSDGCEYPETPIQKSVKIGSYADNSYIDDLYIGGTQAFVPDNTCDIVYRQQLWIKSEDQTKSYSIPTNYQYFRLLGTFNQSQARSRLAVGSGTSAQCEDWPNDLH